jgi:hypothetical protein
LKTLGSSVDHQVAGQSAHILSPNGADGSANALNQHDRITSDGSLFEWGPPSDVLELTRADIFEKLLSLRDDERQRSARNSMIPRASYYFPFSLALPGSARPKRTANTKA